MMDITPLGDAYNALLDAATSVADSKDTIPAPPGEWSADQILAHVAIINAVTIAAVSAIASGTNATYDNRIAQDAWTIDRITGLAGGNVGLRDRIRVQGEALCALGGSMLSDAELDTPIATRLLSNGTLVLDQPVPLRDLITGLAQAELPGHTEQLLALLSNGAGGEPTT